MRKSVVVALAVTLTAIALVTGSPRKFGRPQVVFRSTDVQGSIGHVTVVIHKDEWPDVWRPSLEYSATMIGNPDKGMLLSESITMDVGGVSHLILTCYGILEFPEPRSICRAPAPQGIQPPGLIKSFRYHMNVYRVMYQELSRQRDEANRELERVQNLLRQSRPSPSPDIY